MNSNPPPTTYTAIARGLHWLIGLGMIGLLCIGVFMVNMPFSPTKLQIYSWHKWAGVTIFVLSAFRLAWRISHRPPQAPVGMPAWQRIAAEGVHHLLYLLMFAIPLSGWLMSSAKGFQTVFFGVLPIPDLLGKNAELGEVLEHVHGGLNLALAALVLLHTAAAIKHHLIDRDDVLSRMLPILKPRKSN